MLKMENHIEIEEIKKTIRSVIADLTELEADSIDDNALFTEELGISSITIVQIFLSCQDEYDVVLANEMNLAEPLSVNLMAELVQSKMKSECE
jgi:acyl carrier protein